MINPQIEKDVLYIRTQEGEDEAQRPRRGLPTGALRILGKIDGHRCVGDLASFVRPFELPGILLELETQLLVERSEHWNEQVRTENRKRQQKENALLGTAKQESLKVLEKAFEEAEHVWVARIKDAINIDVLRMVLREAVDIIAKRKGEKSGLQALAEIRRIFDVIFPNNSE